MLNYILIISIVSLVFMGCGSSENGLYPSNARGVSNAFLKELSAGDLEGALLYCDNDGEVFQNIESITEKNMIHEFAVTFAGNEEDQKSIEENKYIQKWIHSYYEAMFKNYQIIDVHEDGNRISFEVGISRIDIDEDELFGYFVGSDLFNDYYHDNQEELDALLEEEGVNAVIRKFIDEKGKNIAERYMDTLNNATYSNINYYITLEKVDGQWKIIEFQCS